MGGRGFANGLQTGTRPGAGHKAQRTITFLPDDLTEWHEGEHGDQRSPRGPDRRGRISCPRSVGLAHRQSIGVNVIVHGPLHNSEVEM